MKKKLYRSSSNRIIAGVMGGIAEYFNINAFWLRIIFVILIAFTFVTIPFAILFYLLMIIIVSTKETESFYQYFKGNRSNNQQNHDGNSKTDRKILHDVEEHDAKK